MQNIKRYQVVNDYGTQCHGIPNYGDILNYALICEQ